MSEPAPISPEAPKRSTTGAIPLNWAMPAEMSANAAGLEQHAASTKTSPPAARSAIGPAAIMLAASVSLGLVVGVFYDDLAQALRARLETSDSPLALQILRALPAPASSQMPDAPHLADVVVAETDGAALTAGAAALDAPAASALPDEGAVTEGVTPSVARDAIDAAPAAATADVAAASPAKPDDLGAFGDVIEEIPATPPTVARPDDVAPVEPTSGQIATTSTTPTSTTDTSEGAPPGAGDVTVTATATAPTESLVRLKELPVRKKVRQMVTKAEGLIKAGRHDDAVLLLQRAETVDGSYPLLHRTRGIAEASRGQTDAARAAYRRYLKLAPNAPDAADVRRILGE